MKNLKYFCCSVIFIIILMFSVSNAAVCSKYGSSHRYAAATCTKPRTCACGAKSGSALGHNYKVTSQTSSAVGSKSVCTKITEKKKCTRCGISFSSVSFNREHSYTASTEKKATCTETGLLRYKCKNCSYSYTSATSKSSHSYNSATCTLPRKCKNCGATVGSALGHNYSGYENYSDTQHYRKCNRCGNKSKENHEFVNGICTKCYTKICNHTNQSEATCTEPAICINCKKEMSKALGHRFGEYVANEKYHVRFCERCNVKNEKVHVFVKDEVLKEATCMENGEIRYICNTCKYTKTEESEKGDHDFETSERYSTNSTKHAKRCKWCGAVDYSSEELHSFVNGICKICNHVCKHLYVPDENGIEENTRCSWCGVSKSNDACEHDFAYISDTYGHYYRCTKCKYTDNSKSGVHKYGNSKSDYTDLCNGYHEKVCTVKECGYALKSPHIYSNGKCSSCGADNSTGIQTVKTSVLPKSVNPKTLQEKLEYLGYDIGSSGADGKIGKSTIDALNELLKDQGSTRVIKDKSGITVEVYGLVLRCQETSVQAKKRIEKKEMLVLEKELKAKFEEGTISTNEEIQYVQILLQKLGYYASSESIKTSLDDKVKNAIKAFYIVNGIELDSEIDKNFFAKNGMDLISKISNTTKTYIEVKKERVSQINSGVIKFNLDDENQRKEIQLMLQSLGYYEGQIDGKMNITMQKAIMQLLADKGKWKGEISKWDQISLNDFILIADTTEKGLNKFIRSNQNDMTFIGAVRDCNAYYAEHNFRYCQNHCDKNVTLSGTNRNYCAACKAIYENSEARYTVDCSSGLTAYLYQYALANGSEKMAADFGGRLRSKDFWGIANNNDGVYNGTKYFEIVTKDELREGDIMVTDGHVEVYAGEMSTSKLAKVYNTGSNQAIASAGPTESTHDIDEYVFLRVISPEEVQALDNE